MTKTTSTLLYDGNCGFCRIWIEYWRCLTAGKVEYLAAQDRGDRFPQVDPQAYSEAVQLVRPDGSVSSGAAAVFETLGWEGLYRSSRAIAALSEAAYRFIADRRNLFYHVTKWTFGTRIEPTRFAATQWLFLRLLAVVYAVAFASIGVQVRGLIGAQGILPAVQFLQSMGASLGASRYFLVPTLFWWGAGDETLLGMSIVGVLLSLLLFVTGFRKGIFERLLLILLFVIYLSFSTAGQDFLIFQWDSLLLEAGFLAIFLGRNRIVPWMFRWLVFRLHFLSGSVKLLSQDVSWHNLSAIGFHYYTQPLPTVFAWYMEQLPAWFHKLSTVVVLGAEIGIPFLIFGPRRWRRFAAVCLLGLQVLILLTGNYGFFNILTMALCVFLFDDRAVGWLAPSRVRTRLVELPPAERIELLVATAVSIVILTLGLTRLMETVTGDAPPPLRAFATAVSPFQMVNSYGLFSIMTVARTEIIVEGSVDGQIWRAYEFRYKPGDVHQAPRWAAPHQPRLDWQMWFAALGSYRENPWFVNFAVRLLEGSPAVTSLLESNPFPDGPPQFIRARAYQYQFTDWATHRRTGDWWKRQLLGDYLPVIGLRQSQPAQPNPK